MSRYTPGPGGYALAVVVSVLVLPGVLAVTGLLTGGGAGDLGELALAWPVLAAWAAIPASVVGLIGVLLVHGWCRDQPSQAVHVAAAFVAGVLVPTAFSLPFALLDGLEVAAFALVLSVPIGVSAAIGRATVIPLVRCRSRRLASAPPVRVP